MVDIKVIYEMNPPKVLYNNYFDDKIIGKNIDLFLSRTRRISEYVDGIHLTDNVLGIPRVSSLMIVSMLKKMGISKPISCTCRLYDKNLLSVLQFVTDSIIAGVYSILILRGDKPIIGNKILDIPPTKIIKTLSAHNFNNFIKLDLSFPNRIENSAKIKNKLEARPRAFVTQSISSIENLKTIVEVSKPFGIDVIPCIMCPTKRNEISAMNIGLDWSSYVKEPEKFIHEAAELTNKVLLCSPNSFEDGLNLVKKLKQN
jgi:5,10-methylenetetrahydrofolate reductase